MDSRFGISNSYTQIKYMIREDYIMRMIEQLVKVLAKILSNKESENYQEAINNIESAFNNILGLDYNLISALSDKDIISLLKISKDNASLEIKCIIIAKLLKEKAEINNLINNENLNLVYDYQKALSLFLEGILNNKNVDIDLRSYHVDVEEIMIKINDTEISEDTRFKLSKFYELIDENGKAENELRKRKGTNYHKT